VGIARAFMLDPPLVLADEPVASLDPRTSRDIMDLLHAQSRQRGTTVLCSLHQVDLAQAYADRIVALRDGAVVFDGTPDMFNEERVQSTYARGTSDDAPQPMRRVA
jgi:phosphonate transport system ATP-binding protein